MLPPRGLDAGRETTCPAPETANHAAPKAVTRCPFVSPGFVARIAVERVAVVEHLRRAVGPRRRRELGRAEPRPRHGHALRPYGWPRGGAGGGAGALAAGILAEQVHGAPARVDEHFAEAAGGLEPDGRGPAARGLRWPRCVAAGATGGDGQGGERHGGGRGHDASGGPERVHRADSCGAAAATETTLRSADTGARSPPVAGMHPWSAWRRVPLPDE